MVTSRFSLRAKWCLAALIVVLSSVQLGFFYSFLVSALRDPQLSPSNERGGLPLVPVWIITNATGIVCDGLIMVSMTIILYGSRKVGGDKSQMTPILDSLILFSVSTGLTNVLLHTASLVTFVLVPNASIYAAISFIYPKSYVNSALASLNSRDMLRERIFDEDNVWVGESVKPSSTIRFHHPKSGTEGTVSLAELSPHMERSQTSHGDLSSIAFAPASEPRERRPITDYSAEEGLA